MDVRFACTQCGLCCQNLKLPLTVAETIDWLADGNAVQIICDALPSSNEPAADDHKAVYRRRRSFAAVSGAMPAQVAVILAASFVGKCPNLMADSRCGIYARRPLVCRVYPAEINPFITLEPRLKVCPPEAWAAEAPLLQRDGVLTDEAVRRDVERSRDAAARDAHVKARLCAALGIDSAAVADEGFVVYSPDRVLLLNQIERAAAAGGEIPPRSWTFVSNRAETAASIAATGAVSSLVRDGDTRPYQYLGFKATAA
jgi:Fe-S-cluster containining protein